MFDAQLMVENLPYTHLEFAIKHEHIDLLVLKKIWFLYEFLLKIELPLEDLPTGKYDDILNKKKYIVNENFIKSKRHQM